MAHIIARCLDERTERFGFVSPDTSVSISIAMTDDAHRYHVDIYDRDASSVRHVAEGVIDAIDGFHIDLKAVHNPVNPSIPDVQSLMYGGNMARHCFRPYLANLNH